MNSHPFRKCDKCTQPRPPEGGVELRPGRWFCATCWAGFTNRKKS